MLRADLRGEQRRRAIRRLVGHLRQLRADRPRRRHVDRATRTSARAARSSATASGSRPGRTSRPAAPRAPRRAATCTTRCASGGGRINPVPFMADRGSALAEHRTRPVSRVKPATVFSTVAVGAVTASVVAAGGPAMAEPDYPSWSEIEQAKQNEQTKQAEIDRVGDLLVGLQRAADAAAAGVDAGRRGVAHRRRPARPGGRARANARAAGRPGRRRGRDLEDARGPARRAPREDRRSRPQRPSSCSRATTRGSCSGSSAWRRSSASSRTTSTSRRSPTATRPTRSASRQRMPRPNASDSPTLAEQRADEAGAAADAANAAVAEQEQRSTSCTRSSRA